MKGHLLKSSLSVVLFLILVSPGNPAEVATETTIEAIMADPDSFDGKEVVVSGAVSGPRFKASRHGKPYVTFPVVSDSGGRINVFAWGAVKLRRDQKIRITGVYRRTMEMGRYTFRDMIESSEIKTD